MWRQVLRNSFFCACLLALAPLAAFSQPAAVPGATVVYVGKPADCAAAVGGKVFARAMGGPAGGFALTSVGGVALNAKGSKERPVTGAPYSGVGTTETVQTLADGNRIVHTNTVHYFRDSAGRTRTEYTLSAVGPFTLDEARTLVLIDDPMSGKRFVMHPAQRTAEALPSLGATQFGDAPPAAASSTSSVTAAVVAPPMSMAPGPAVCPPGVKAAPVPVSLGQKSIQGLKATGTQVEYTIAAGEIGNEQPIVVRSEQWVSDDLGVVLTSTQSDPMIGDTTYHLDQIARTEPDPALFAVPSDYTVQTPTVFKAFKLTPGSPAAGGSAAEQR